jgi:hypothetical protein
MQQPPTDYMNWLCQQEGLIALEEAQLYAEEQWLRQKEHEIEQKRGTAIALVLLQTLARVRTQTPYERQKNWLRWKYRELENKCVSLQARKAWLQAQKTMYGIP